MEIASISWLNCAGGQGALFRGLKHCLSLCQVNTGPWEGGSALTTILTNERSCLKAKEMKLRQVQSTPLGQARQNTQTQNREYTMRHLERAGVALVHKQNMNQPCKAAAKHLVVSKIVLTRVLFARPMRQWLQPAWGWQGFSQVWVSRSDEELYLHPLRDLECPGWKKKSLTTNQVNDKRSGKQVLRTKIEGTAFAHFKREANGNGMQSVFLTEGVLTKRLMMSHFPWSLV